MSAVSGHPPRTFHFLTPTFRPAGGVVKLFDYLVHALDLGYLAEVYCPAPLREQEPLLSIPRFSYLREDPRVSFRTGLNVGVGAADWLLFSWPPHYEVVARGMSPDAHHERAIHLVQNTRHANPMFADGFATRLLARPMARIMVAQEVMQACRPHLNEHSLTRTIVEAHDWRFFHREREGGISAPVRIGYTTWKSEIGIEVERAVQERGLGDRFAFGSIRGTATWQEIRTLLHWCDVFLCCPNREEGFYLPGLEAFAAGAIAVTPDVGGNLAYSRFGENCIEVGFEDVEDYVRALIELARLAAQRIVSLRKNAYATLAAHTLERERDAFANFMIELYGRCSQPLPWN